MFVRGQSFSVKTFDRSRNGCQVIREGAGNDFRGPSVQALPLPSRVSSRARFFLCPLLPSACYAGYLSLSWDKVDLELWTVTFAGLAKPHCNVCSSPYQEDVCPSADLNRKSRRPQSVCFDFNKSSGCRRRNCSFPHGCRRCYSSTHPAPECTQPQPSSANKAPTLGDRSKK